MQSTSLFLLLLPKMYGWVEYRGSKIAELHTHGPRYKSSGSLFPLLFVWVKILYIYNKPDAHTYYHGCTFSSVPLTHCTWTCLLLACYPHKFLWSHLQPATYTRLMITLPSSMPSTQFMQCFYLKHLHPVYFRFLFCSTKVQLLPLYRQMSKESSSQHPTIFYLYL